MLNDRGEPVPTWRCTVKYAPQLANCKASFVVCFSGQEISQALLPICMSDKSKLLV